MLTPSTVTVAIVSAGSMLGCDAFERAIDGKAAPFKEPELPNCSRVLNCCTNLSDDAAVSALAVPTCDVIATPTDTAIVQYQQAKAVILGNKTTTQAEKDALLKDLRETTQATLEPACRCLIDETLGNISLDGFLTPLDCEVVESTGSIPAGKTCDELTGAITGP
jgi:hypothetical protein